MGRIESESNDPDSTETIEQIFESLATAQNVGAATSAGEALGQLFEEVKQRADADVAAARAAQQHAEIEKARAEERAAAAVRGEQDEARRHAEELRRLEKAYDGRTEALTALSAAHQIRAERAEAEADRLREELAGLRAAG